MLYMKYLWLTFIGMFATGKAGKKVRGGYAVFKEEVEILEIIKKASTKIVDDEVFSGNQKSLRVYRGSALTDILFEDKPSVELSIAGTMLSRKMFKVKDQSRLELMKDIKSEIQLKSLD